MRVPLLWLSVRKESVTVPLSSVIAKQGGACNAAPSREAA